MAFVFVTKPLNVMPFPICKYHCKILRIFPYRKKFPKINISGLFFSCVPVGYCGGAFCAKNAVCLFDHLQNVQYCSCPEGFVGDGLESCKSVPPPCNIKNNCGLNAQCVPTSDNKYECACNSGFYGDGFICVPEINCMNVPQLCHEQGRCIHTASGYQCVCNAGKWYLTVKGFKIRSAIETYVENFSGYIGNGTYCTEPFRQEHAFLLLSQGVAIVKFPLNGNRGSPIAMAGVRRKLLVFPWVEDTIKVDLLSFQF